jgi:hypothetical protein
VSRCIQLGDSEAWERLQPGQFAVFFSDPRTDVLVDERGGPAGVATSVAVFDSLAEAERYAGQIVTSGPVVCAAIYDHHGRAGDPLRRIYHESVRRRFDPQRSARRSAWVGGWFLVAFTVWAWIAAFSTDEHFLWFYILGVKLFILGTVLFVRGIGYFLGNRVKT